MARTVAEIQKEYVQVCTNAGDMTYRIKCFEQDLVKLHNRMLELNQEATEASATEKAAANEPKAE
jgi:hypothetical protein